MEWRLLREIPFFLDTADFLAQMCIKPGSSQAESCQKLIDQALSLAKPRALYLPKRVEELDESGMTVDGVRFSSKLFLPRLRVGEEIYFFLATCGAEIGALRHSFRDDLLRGYWADCLAERVLWRAVAALEEALSSVITDKYLAALNPGSLPEWPLFEQKPLFALLGGAAAACGVSLNEYCVMQPQKSVSGFYFSSDKEYYNCELCPRLRCPGRRAACIEQVE